MSLHSENVIPGEHGKVFETNAKTLQDLKRIREVVMEVEGVRKVELNAEVFPKEITVLSKSFVPIKTIEKAVQKIGFHAIARTHFHL